MVNDIAVQDFVNAIKEEPTDSNTTYNATVSRVDKEGVVWVNIHGSDKETPTASTSSEVKRGDVVPVSWRNNKLYIGGNYTNPSAGIGTVQPSVDYVSQLIGKDITVNSINAASAYIGELESKNIKAEDITADHAAVDNLDANYAKINAANITDLSAQNAWVNKIMVQTGLIAHESDIFTLDAIQVNAANITAGTLDVNRLIVTVDGQKYLVNVDPTTGTPSYEKMDGNIVEPRTITADKIVAHDITVQEITTENLVGTNGWINLNQGKFFYTTNGSTWANTTNGIMWDGTSLKIKGDVNITAGNVYTKTQSDTALAGKVGNNEVITKINASSEGVQIQASKVNIQGVITAINNDTSTTINGNKITTGTISASDIYIGADVLTDVVSDITDDLGNIYQLNILTTYTSTAVVHTAQLLQNGVDIASQTPNDFEWNAKLTTGYQFIGNGVSVTIPQSSLNYGHAVTVSWTRRQYAYLLNNSGNNLVTNTGNKLIGRTEY